VEGPLSRGLSRVSFLEFHYSASLLTPCCLVTNCSPSSYFLRNPEQLGGHGRVVEVDETCISRRKYNRGRLIVEQQWFVTGNYWILLPLLNCTVLEIERNSRKAFVEPVQQRDRATLNAVIQVGVLVVI
jgi:hypothetical protein